MSENVVAHMHAAGGTRCRSDRPSPSPAPSTTPHPASTGEPSRTGTSADTGEPGRTGTPGSTGEPGHTGTPGSTGKPSGPSGTGEPGHTGGSSGAAGPGDSRSASGTDDSGADGSRVNDSSASDSSASGNSTSHHSTDGYEQAGTVRPEAPRPGSLAALTGSVHLIMPASAWLGQTDAPGEVTGHGSLDADTCRDLAERLAASPGTRWCVTLTTPDGRAAAHACSRHGPSPPITPTPPGAPGSTSPSPAASSPSAPSSTTSHPANRPPPATGTLRTGQAAAGPWPPPATDTLRTGQMAAGPWPPPATDAIPIAGLADWLAGLKMAWLESGTCGHARQTAGYRPSPLLAHLITIRQRTCSFPGCRRPAWRCDQDHTIPHDQGGRTCECNLSALCRQHHRTKQAPDWHLTQPQPGVLTWTPPHGRTYTVIPQPYLT